MGFSTQPKDQQSIFYLGNGWSWQEDWGTWSDGAVAVVNILWPNQTPRTLKIDLIINVSINAVKRIMDYVLKQVDR